MSDCDCLICPLVAAKFNICNMKIKVISTKAKNRYCVGFEDAIPENLKDSIQRLVLYVRNERKIKVGESSDGDNEYYNYHIFRDDRETFTLCFHTKPNDTTAAINTDTNR